MARSFVAPFARAMETVKETDRERTSYRFMPGGSFDVEVKVWNAREVMARAIRMQEKRGHNSQDWNAVVKLSPGEGY